MYIFNYTRQVANLNARVVKTSHHRRNLATYRNVNTGLKLVLLTYHAAFVGKLVQITSTTFTSESPTSKHSDNPVRSFKFYRPITFSIDRVLRNPLQTVHKI